MAKEKNYIFAVDQKGKDIYLYVVGNSTMSFPFLAKSSEQLVTPFYLMEGDKIGMTAKEAIYFSGSKQLEYEPEDIPVCLKNLRIPTIAINISEKKFNNVLKISDVFNDIPKSIKPDGKIVIFLPIVSFDEEAIYLHKEVFKGDTIACFGVLRNTKISALSRNVTALWCNDIRKVQK